MSLNLNFFLVRLLHFDNFCDWSSNVDVLAVFDEHLGLELAVGKHVFNVEFQLVGHVDKILVYLLDAIVEIGDVLVNTLLQSWWIKLLDEVLTDSFDDAGLVHDWAQWIFHLMCEVGSQEAQNFFLTFLQNLEI